MELRSSGQRVTRQSTRQTSKDTITTNKLDVQNSTVPTSKVPSVVGVNNTTTAIIINKEIKQSPSMPIRRSSRSISNNSDTFGSKRPTRNAVLNSVLKPAFASLIEKRRNSTVKTYSRASTTKNTINSTNSTLQSSSKTIPNTTSSQTDKIPIQNEEKSKVQLKDHHQTIQNLFQRNEEPYNEINDDNQSMPTTTSTANEEANLEDKHESDNLIEDDGIANKETIRNDKNNNSVANQIIIEDASTKISNPVNITSLLCNDSEGDNNNTQVSFIPYRDDNNNKNASDEILKHSSIRNIKVLNEHKIENYLDYEIDIQIEEFYYCCYCDYNFINYEKFQDHKLKKCPESNDELALEGEDEEYNEQDEEYAEDPLRIYEDEDACEFECSPIFSKSPTASSSSSSATTTTALSWPLSSNDSTNNNNQINSIVDEQQQQHDFGNSNNGNNNTKYLFAASAYKYYITTTSVTNSNINHDTSECNNGLLHMRTSTALSNNSITSYYNHEKSPDQKCNPFSKITILPADFNHINTGNQITSPATTKILVPLKNFMLNCKRPLFLVPVDNELNGEVVPWNYSTDNTTTHNLFDSTMIDISPKIDNSVTSTFVNDTSNSFPYSTLDSVASTTTTTSITPSSSPVACGNSRRKNKKILHVREDDSKVSDPLDIDHTYFNHIEIEDQTKNEKKMAIDQKYILHLTSEQLRRQNLRQLFQTLKDYIPKHYHLQQNSSKVMILNKTVEYVKAMESAEKSFRLEKDKLIEKNQKLWDTFNSFSKYQELNETKHPGFFKL